MIKKLLAALLVITLSFSAAGGYVFHDETTVSAKGYKSGKKGFSNNNTNNNFNSNIQKKDTNKSDSSVANKSAANKGGFMGGGMMKGLMLGGLAGLMFGGLLANMGALGSFIGLLVNVLAIIVVIALIRGIFNYFKNKRRREDSNSWRS
ncbi:hypothetical protein [Bacillus massiliglaciei]|uniref:hypothetical protein n=1 Tax=Bacillus massiliglaciei TaxID=1816693 RepID=UPI000ABFB182|nr:hypothetical protein [Bacillus massiliglaciei]